MKVYDKQIHIFELDTKEVELLDSTLRKVNGILAENKIDLTDDEQNIIDDTIDNADSILHP